MVSSRVYPDLERKPGGPDNWVEATGGLPKYIERIAKHLHYERGYTISHAISTAVNTVKRWAVGGTVTKYGTTKRVSPATAAKAAAAVAQWEAKKARSHIQMSDAGVEVGMRAILASMDINDLAQRANAIEDPGARAAARARVLDLAAPGWDGTVDLSSSIPPRNARGKATDGRPSFKGQGKWKHGFIPADTAAAEAKAKGSPIAMKRMRRLFKPSEATGRAGQRTAPHKQNPDRLAINDKNKGTERVQSIGQLRGDSFKDPRAANRARGGINKDASKDTRLPERARQNWDEIPDNLKTVRNGKKYVVAEFNGRQVITEWVGGVNDQTPDPLAKRKVMSSITMADAMKMSTADLDNMLRNPQTPDNVRKVLNKALRQKRMEAATRG